MKKQEKYYLSHEAVELLEAEKRRTTLPKSTIVELLIRQQLTTGGVVPLQSEATAPVKTVEINETPEVNDNGEENISEDPGFTPLY